MNEPIRLTQYSHGAGCGCKISPQVLEVILAGSGAQNLDPNLWVGNASRDDAAVYAIDDERGVVSTTDFFMPIVDDPFDFGRIAATNAISDIYAMGRPVDGHCHSGLAGECAGAGGCPRSDPWRPFGVRCRRYPLGRWPLH